MKLLLFSFLFAFSCSKTEETGTPEPAPTPFSVTVTTAAVNNVTATSAQTGATIEVTGKGSIKSKGICWATTPTPTISTNKIEAGTGTDTFTSTLSALTSGTTYYVRSFVTDDKNTTFYGNELSFTTQYNVQVTTSPITIKSSTSVELTGTIAVTGGENLKSRGFCYGTTPLPTIANSKVELTGTTGTFTALANNLSSQNTYFVRAYAVAQNDVVFYGNDVTFKTTAPSAPQPTSITVSTTEASSITTGSANVGGSVNSSGTGMVAAKGICWSTTSSPTVSNSKTTLSSGTGSFQSTLTNLQANTRYYARAWAWDEMQTVTYGNEITFTTAGTAPVPTTNKITVTSSAVSSITSTSAVTGGNVAIEGLEVATARGVCYGTNPNPTTTGPKTSNGSGAGAFTSNLTGLSANSKYYVRAYAVSGSGNISYGNELSFTTSAVSSPPPNTPTVPANPNSYQITTTLVSNNSFFGAYSAQVSASAKRLSGAETIEFLGICWAKSPSPTRSEADEYVSPTQIEKTEISRKFIMKDLVKNTKYYVRSYVVTDQKNVYYGNEISFTTPFDFHVQTLTGKYDDLNDLLKFTADVFNSPSEQYATLGFLWSTTNQYPTTSDNKITTIKTVPGGLGSPQPTDAVGFEGSIKPKPQTKHYWRAYAITAQGRLVYGDIVTTYSGSPYTPPVEVPPTTPPPGTTPPGTTPPSGGGGTPTNCLSVTAKGFNTNCTNNFSVTVKNGCSGAVDVKIAILKADGTVWSGVSWGVAGGNTYTWSGCNGSGKYQYFSKPAGSSTAFPTDAQIKSGSWLQ